MPIANFQLDWPKQGPPFSGPSELGFRFGDLSTSNHRIAAVKVNGGVVILVGFEIGVLDPEGNIGFPIEGSVRRWNGKRVKGGGPDPELGISDLHDCHGEEEYDSGLENDKGYTVEYSFLVLLATGLFGIECRGFYVASGVAIGCNRVIGLLSLVCHLKGLLV